MRWIMSKIIQLWFGDTRGAGTSYPSGPPEFVPVISRLVLFMLSNITFRPCDDFRYAFDVNRCSVHLYSHLFCRRFMLHLYCLYWLTYNGVQHDFHISICCWYSYKQWMTLVGHGLRMLSIHFSSPTVFVRFMFLNLSFLCNVL